MIRPQPNEILLPGGTKLSLARPVIVGILNVTPDSFSDGGTYLDPLAAARHARDMVRQGAGVIDIGPETTQPGSAPVSPEEQWRRLAEVLHALVPAESSPTSPAPGVPISIDTQSATVAQQALAAGAAIINDISAGRDPRMFQVVAQAGAGLILMHMQGDPATMQRAPAYRDVVAEVREFLLARAAAAVAAGVSARKIVIDPGLGFGKTVAHNLALLANLPVLVATGYPVLLGASRKRFLAALPGAGAGASAGDTAAPRSEARLGGTCATTALGVAAGVALFRVHDVGPNRQAADLAWALTQQRRAPAT
jgi:dihydropteroate synthase